MNKPGTLKNGGTELQPGGWGVSSGLVATRLSGKIRCVDVCLRGREIPTECFCHLEPHRCHKHAIDYNLDNLASECVSRNVSISI